MGHNYVVVVGLLVCAGCPSPPLEVPEASCNVLASLYGTYDVCEPPNRQQHDVRGVWEYVDCEYVAASPNFQSQIGLACSGRLALCGEANTSDITWQDIGPNGVGIGTAQDVQLSSYDTSDGNKQFQVFGTVDVTDPQGSCTASVEVSLLCVGTTAANCSKLSNKVTTSCGVEPGWVLSGFQFRRVSACP